MSRILGWFHMSNVKGIATSTGIEKALEKGPSLGRGQRRGLTAFLFRGNPLPQIQESPTSCLADHPSWTPSPFTHCHSSESHFHSKPSLPCSSPLTPNRNTPATAGEEEAVERTPKPGFALLLLNNAPSHPFQQACLTQRATLCLQHCKSDACTQIAEDHLGQRGSCHLKIGHESPHSDERSNTGFLEGRAAAASLHLCKALAFCCIQQPAALGNCLLCWLAA